MKIVNVKSIGHKPVYDLSVNSYNYDDQHYVLENGVVTHNTGPYYSADNLFIMGRNQEKQKDEFVGYNFIINVEKSRYVKEKSKIPITVTFDGGMSKWSGLMDVALESGHVFKPKKGVYSKYDEGKEWKEEETNCEEFWSPILKDKSFCDFIEQKYCLSDGKIISDSTITKTFEDAVEA